MYSELELQDQKSKSPVGIWGANGTSVFAELGDKPVMAFTTMGGFVYALTRRALWRVHANGRSEYLGDTSISTDGVSIDNNGQIIVWVDGYSGWFWNPSIGVRPIYDANWYPGHTVVYYDTYFVFDREGTQQFFLSPPNWNGLTPFVNASDTTGVSFQSEMLASKEATSDLIVACANSHEQLFLFGEKRTEVWFDAGNAPPTFPFQRSYGALVQRGLIAPYAVVLEDNTVFFLGDDLVFYRLNAFVPERQSNHAIESQWQEYPDHFHTRAFSYTVMGHKMIVLIFPAAKKTWVLDLSTKRWHERESWTGNDADSSIGRWRVNAVLNNSSSVETYPEVLFGDCLSGRIDQMNNEVFTEFGETMRAMIIAPPIHSDRRRIFMRKFEIDVETGVGLPYASEVTNEFCPAAITMTTPSQLSTTEHLANEGDAFSAFVFSNWVNLPDDGTPRGLFFGNSGLQIFIVNDETNPTAQIKVLLYDAAGAPILDAEYPWTTWGAWVWVGITCDVLTHQIQCWVSTAGVGDTQLTASTLVWSSTNEIANTVDDPWFFKPSSG